MEVLYSCLFNSQVHSAHSMRLVMQVNSKHTFQRPLVITYLTEHTCNYEHICIVINGCLKPH